MLNLCWVWSNWKILKDMFKFHASWRKYLHLWWCVGVCWFTLEVPKETLELWNETISIILTKKILKE
jgi:hypothetical protein